MIGRGSVSYTDVRHGGRLGQAPLEPVIGSYVQHVKHIRGRFQRRVVSPFQREVAEGPELHVHHTGMALSNVAARGLLMQAERSEERRVGKECRCGWGG